MAVTRLGWYNTTDASLNEKRVEVFFDDGCNMNVISKDFLSENRNLFDIVPQKVTLHHSDKGFTEDSNEVVRAARLEFGSHIYESNFVVRNCRYVVLLGMTWNCQSGAKKDY